MCNYHNLKHPYPFQLMYHLFDTYSNYFPPYNRNVRKENSSEK